MMLPKYQGMPVTHYKYCNEDCCKGMQAYRKYMRREWHRLMRRTGKKIVAEEIDDKMNGVYRDWKQIRYFRKGVK